MALLPAQAHYLADQVQTLGSAYGELPGLWAKISLRLDRHEAAGASQAKS